MPCNKRKIPPTSPISLPLSDPTLPSTSPLPFHPPSPHPAPLTVTQVIAQIRTAITSSFSKEVCIQGEITGLKPSAAGHRYFALKDSTALINAIAWKSLKTPLENGMEVICHGTIAIHSERSNYQIIVSKVEVAGIGRLLALIEERKQRLTAEGLFTAERKQPIPPFPRTIAVITSPTGAVIQDIIRRLNDRRYPVTLLIYGVLVQGKGAAAEISQAIRQISDPAFFTGHSLPLPDTVIIARGGGSFEDLLPFSDEEVVRAAAACPLPLISAIGHETDYTLLDLTADYRAPTPTAAAEKSVPVLTELTAELDSLRRRLQQLVENAINRRIILVEQLIQRITSHSASIDRQKEILQHLASMMTDRLQHYLNQRSLQLEKLAGNIRQPLLFDNRCRNKAEQLETLRSSANRAIVNHFTRCKTELDNLRKLLISSNYSAVLQRGFAMVERPESGEIITSVAAVQQDERLRLTFKDGSIIAKVEALLTK